MEPETRWLTRTELVTRYPLWGSASTVDHLFKDGYLRRRMDTRLFVYEKAVGAKRVNALYHDIRAVWVYDAEQYCRYWESNLQHKAVLAELREENGYDG